MVNTASKTITITVVMGESDDEPVILGELVIYLEVGDTFDPLDGISASDTEDGDITTQITYIILVDDEEVETVDTAVLAVYDITYQVTDSFGNTGELLVEVTVQDTTPPVITMNDEYELTNDEVLDVTLLGSAHDNYDGDIDFEGITFYDVDWNEIEFSEIGVGVFRVQYHAMDSSMNSSYYDVTLYISDAVAPEIHYYSEFIHVFDVTAFDPYDYFTVTDETTLLEDLTVTVQFNNEALEIVTDITMPGNYTMMVTVIDEAGNETSMPFALNTDPVPILVDFIDAGSAKTYIEEFYSDMLLVDTADFCYDYVEGTPFEMELDLVTCIADVDAFKVEVTSVTVNGDVLKDGVTNEYMANVTFTTSEGERTFDVFFDFRGLIYDTMFYIHINSNPFRWVPVFEEMTPLDTLIDLTDFYDFLLGTGDSSDVCAYIMELDESFDQPVSECIAGIDAMRALITLVTIEDIFVETITPSEGDPIPGYRAIITFDTAEGEQAIEFLYGVVYRNGEYDIFPFGDPFGMDDNGPAFITVDTSFAETMILQYYADLTAALIDADGFCEYYVILDDDMQVMSQTDCTTYKLTNISTDPDEFVVNSVTFYEGEMPTYEANVTRGTETYDVYFYFTEDTFVRLWVVANNATGDLIIDIDTGPTFVDVDEMDAFMYITMFYHDLNDYEVTDEEFCIYYHFLNDDMSPKDTAGCEAFRAYASGLGHVFIIGDIIFHPSDGESPPFYEVNVTRMDALPFDFVAYFLFVEGHVTPVLPMTIGNNAIGELDINIGGGGGSLTEASLTIEEAFPLISAFYVDLMDDTLSSGDFCAEYVIQTDDMEPMEAAGCTSFRDGVNTSYIFITDTLEFIEGQDGPSAYVMNMIRTLDGVDHEYQAVFFIFEDQDANIILFVTGNNAIGDLTIPIGGSGPGMLDVDYDTAVSLINAYYNDMVNPSVLEEDFCTTYLLLDIEMTPYEHAYCMSEITDIRMNNFTFDISNYVHTDANPDSPAYWTVEVERFNGVIIYIYNVSFLFIDSGGGVPMLAVQYEVSVGMTQ